MTDYRVTEETLGPAAMRSFRDMDEVDAYWSKFFKGRERATRKEFPPSGAVVWCKWWWGKLGERRLV